MNEGVRKDILAMLERVLAILETEEEKDVFELEELSNHIIHSATIFQDDDSISTAVLVYSIYKIIKRTGPKPEIYSKIMPIVKESRRALENNELEKYRAGVKALFKLIAELDARFKKYIEEIMEKAKIKKGSKIYEHGISIARVAEILGISQWDLMSYVGKTEITEFAVGGLGIESKLKYLRGIFR
jgi:hypothetical protein